MKSRMLPQRFETWLSAAFSAPFGIAAFRSPIVWRLKMPWRKSLKITRSEDVSRIDRVSASIARGPTLRLSTRST
jgi:hypothetical protein